ncbi:hypothetical protein CHI95_15430 [Providencia rettgeri]|uniref:Uncharacterized protein n=1 Tax=Providencia rettgeri TaxID=587 RepID=A0A264VQS7_PRORE|nr:hypothetical protein CHI95_15430 [Providencia rettgeri]
MNTSQLMKMDIKTYVNRKILWPALGMWAFFSLISNRLIIIHLQQNPNFTLIINKLKFLVNLNYGQ